MIQKRVGLLQGAFTEKHVSFNRLSIEGKRKLGESWKNGIFS